MTPAILRYQAMSFDSPNQGEMPYLRALPANYDTKSSLVPLVIFLHGSGERGPILANAARHGPPPPDRS